MFLLGGRGKEGDVRADGWGGSVCSGKQREGGGFSHPRRGSGGGGGQGPGGGLNILFHRRNVHQEMVLNEFPLGLSPTSGRRMSGTSRPSLRQKGFAFFSFIFQAKLRFKRSLGIHLGVPDILLPDIGDQPILSCSRVWLRLAADACPGHLRSVKKKAGRSDFRNQQFEPHKRKMRKMRKMRKFPLTPQRNKGLRRFHRAKTREMRTRKMRKMTS